MLTVNKSFKEVSKDGMFNALVKAVEAIKANNVDNGIIRECKALHSNTTFEDLPPYVKAAISLAVEEFVKRMISEGYSVVAK